MENIILKDIIQFAKKIKECKLKTEILNSDKDYMKRVDNYFGTTRFQSVLLVAVFELNSEGDRPDIKELAKYFKCNTIELFVFGEEFRTIEDKGIFTYNPFQSFMGKSRRSYLISDNVKKSIIENTPYIPKIEETFSPAEICERVRFLLDERSKKDMGTKHMRQRVRELIDNYFSTPFIKYITKLRLTEEDAISYLSVIGENLNGNFYNEISNLASGVFDSKQAQIYYEKSFYDKSSKLVKNNLFKVNKATFFSSASVSLTEKASKNLEKFNIPIRLSSTEKEIKLISHCDLPLKKMFYNESSHIEIESISNSLRQNKHKEIIKSLEEQGYNTGICTLFYGDPGTGKTEGVYQIAKKTGRSIWKVDLSELKSAYFGESQQRVKAMFKDYNNLCKREKRVPILLLNEADAILGKRNSSASSSADIVNNAIQNIFLDCLECFKGILFATTNLEDSLDKAFERRFLFKICFIRPDQQTRIKIWKSKLKGMNGNFLKEVVSQYDLSGGEIDNIVRKFKMARILESEINEDYKLIELCETEKINIKNGMARIGF